MVGEYFVKYLFGPVATVNFVFKTQLRHRCDRTIAHQAHLNEKPQPKMLHFSIVSTKEQIFHHIYRM